MPNALVITAAGINCDRELVEGFQRAGALVKSVHLNRLAADPSIIDDFQLIGLPGGFSYGDAVAAGRIAAVLMRRSLHEALRRAVDRGVPMIAPCNGFQIAVQVGLLPGPTAGEAQPEPPRPTVALAQNEGGRFVDRWTRVTYDAASRCVWTRDLAADQEATGGEDADRTRLLPIAHGEGRFVPGSDELLAELESRGQVAVRYASDDNPNGSVGDIAGICDETGLVFGLMPHPERYLRWTQHPFWTRLDPEAMRHDPPGLRMFQSAVNAASEAMVV